MSAFAEALATAVVAPHTELQVCPIIGRSTILHLTGMMLRSDKQELLPGYGNTRSVTPY